MWAVIDALTPGRGLESPAAGRSSVWLAGAARTGARADFVSVGERAGYG